MLLKTLWDGDQRLLHNATGSESHTIESEVPPQVGPTAGQENKPNTL